MHCTAMTTNKLPGKLTAHLESAFQATQPRPKPVSVEPALLDARRAAALLSVSLRKFHSLRPQLPAPVVLGSRVVRWKTAALREYVELMEIAGPRTEPPQLAASRVERRHADGPNGATLGDSNGYGPESAARRGPGKRPVQSNPDEQAEAGAPVHGGDDGL